LLRQELAQKVSEALDRLIAAGDLPEAARVDFEILDTKNPDHGDYSCNLALIAAKPASLSPRIVGEKLQKELAKENDFQAVDLAGPGFLNFRLKPDAINKYVAQILKLGEDLPKAQSLKPQAQTQPRIEVEFVSVNPNGPITVGSARGAAIGDTYSRILQASGGEVTREYYINDGVNSEQMRLFAESVRAYVINAPLPDKGYKGEYVMDVAKQVVDMNGPSSAEKDAAWFQSMSQDLMIERQRTDLHAFGVDFDIWFSEQKDLHEKNKVKEALAWLESLGNAYWAIKSENAGAEADAKAEEEDQKDSADDQGEPALWLRSAALGDDKDRVLLRADGRPTYLAAEVAYLKDKFDRGYDKCYLLLGPDHHGYIGRTYAVVKALGKEPVKDFEIIIFQLVRFVKDGKPAPMKKRDGNIYELRDLITELGEAVAPNSTKEEQQRTGADVARFFYLMRSGDTHMDFDIDLATKQSDENPVFYVQYAHARICGVLRKAEEVLGSGLGALGSGVNTQLLTHTRELGLIKKILDLPEEVQRTAKDHGVHRIAIYAIELARTFHHFYDACRVIQPEEPELSQARIALAKAAQVALKSALTLLGVSAPEKMERAVEAEA
jgi:arginyl-tRNA synthetase